MLIIPSVLWRCWLGGRKGIRPVKNEWWVAGMVICLERGADLHMAQLMPLPLTVFCFSKIQIGFTFLIPAYPGSPGKRAVKRVCVCMLIQWCCYGRCWRLRVHSTWQTITCGSRRWWSLRTVGSRGPSDWPAASVYCSPTWLQPHSGYTTSPTRYTALTDYLLCTC